MHLRRLCFNETMVVFELLYSFGEKQTKKKALDEQDVVLAAVQTNLNVQVRCEAEQSSKCLKHTNTLAWLHPGRRSGF